ncbi:E3 ubiquitin-protein ligase makorin, partial [Phenoliferia sp. Uapishka_3]
PPSSQPALSTVEIRASIVCQFWLQGYCHRGTTCHYAHQLPSTSGGTEGDKGKEKAEEPKDLSCAICYEMPQKFGLLDTCSHIFCFTCIRDWRESKKADRAMEKREETDCPLCRASVSFITPSSRYFPQGPEKERLTRTYKEKMKKKPCKWLEKSLNEEHLHCPFRNDCYYSHVLPSTGQIHIFPPRPPPRPRYAYGSSRLASELERLGLMLRRGGTEDEVLDLETMLRLLRIYGELGLGEDENESADEEDEWTDEDWS